MADPPPTDRDDNGGRPAGRDRRRGGPGRDRFGRPRRQPLGRQSHGKWTATPAATAPYTTRIVVNRPIDAKKFNGTVVVEWFNVSAGYDGAPDWTAAHNQLIRDGYAWVGVSAQAVGLNATKNADPDRYQALSHPGDSYSYDIFSQTGQAVRKSAGTVLGGLKPKKVLGDGESQSAFRLTTYVNAIHPLVNVYDGVPAAQPRRHRERAVPGPGTPRHRGAGRRPDPTRPHRPGPDLPDRDGPAGRPTRLRRRPPGRHQPLPPVGGRGDRPRRRLHHRHRGHGPSATGRAASPRSTRCATRRPGAPASAAPSRSTPVSSSTSCRPRSRSSTGGSPAGRRRRRHRGCRSRTTPTFSTPTVT